MARSVDQVTKLAKEIEGLWPKKKGKKKIRTLLGLCRELGKEIAREGKTSVDLVREVREGRA